MATTRATKPRPVRPAKPPMRPPVAWRRHVPAALLVLAVAGAAYANSLGGGFALDSKPLILDDARVHAATAANVGSMVQHSYWWPRGESGLYRPLTTASYLFNYAILGNADRPLGYHAVNVALHAANALLVYGLGLELFASAGAAILAAALWAVHPLATEAVSNIVGRADLLAALGVLTALLMYTRSVGTSGWRASGWRVGVLGAALVGVFSKESAAVVVAMIPLYEIARGTARDRLKPMALGSLVAGIAVAVMLVQRNAVLSAAPAPEFPYVDNPIVGAGFWTGRLTALVVAARYLWLFAWPATLSCDYSYAAIPLARGTVTDCLACITIVAATLAAVLSWRRNAAVFFGLAFAAVSLLPASNLLFASGTIMAERLMYLPSVGLTLCVVAAAEAIARRVRIRRLTPVVLGIVATACAARTVVRNSDWHDDLTIWRAAERAYPASYKTHKGIAGTLAATDTSHAAIDTIVAEADRAVAILDQLPDPESDGSAYRDAAGYHLVKSDVLAQQRVAGADADSQREAARALPLLRRYVAIASAAGGRTLSGTTAAATSAMMADGYRLISIASLKAGDIPAALDAAGQARALQPANPANYQQTAVAEIAAHHPEAAAVWLATGAMVTGSADLRPALVGLYRQGLDPDGCAIIAGTADVLNPACPAVRQTMCAAAVETIRIERATGRRDVADAIRAMARDQFKCDPAP